MKQYIHVNTGHVYSLRGWLTEAYSWTYEKEFGVLSNAMKVYIELKNGYLILIKEKRRGKRNV